MNDPSNDPDGETRQNLGDDDENMVSSSEGMNRQGYRFESSSMMPTREKHLRYRTRVFAAECLSHLPRAVGKNPAHFDLSLARKQPANRQVSSDWLVLHVQELISLAYQISTIQFEHMRPIGVGLLSMIIDKFERTQDPELPGHLLLEQYQAQLVSAVRTALDVSAGPLLLEAGLQLATKILTSGVISGDQVAVKRIFSLISRPLNDFKELYYPSFAEWVSCKIKIRLLAAHASLKCYTYAFLRRHHSMIPDEYLALLPLFSKNSNVLGKYWIQVLKDYSYVCLCFHRKKTWSQFLEGIQSPLVSSKLQPCLEESWPVILQALALDSVPWNLSTNEQSKASVEDIAGSLVSGYNMVELEPVEFHFLWGFSLLVLFQGQNLTLGESKLPLFYAKAKHGEDSPIEELDPPGFNLYEIVLPVFQCLATERYFSVGFLTMDISRELLQVLSYATYMDSSFNSLAISVLSQVVQNCPEDFLEIDNFAYLAMELCFTYLFRMFRSPNCFELSTAATSPDQPNWYELISSLFFTAKTLLKRLESKLQKQLESVVLAFLLIGFKCIREASTDLCFSEVNDFVKCTISSLEKLISENFKLGDEGSHYLRAILGTCLNVLANLIKECIKGIHLLDNKRSDLRKLLQMKLAFSVEQTISFAKLVHGIHCLGSNGSDAIYFTLLKYCTECIRMSLVDSNIQVQAIGLQVLKTTVQRALIPEENTFVIFLVGEQIGDIFTLIQQMLKKPLTKESVAVVSECLRILVLLQTLSKGSKSQRGFVNLLFEAIVMVFLASEAEFSREVSDLRSITLKLVSHIAQIPSSAVHFKDVLLSMPPMHRQKLQGVILDSVSQDHNASQMRPLAPLLEVKLSVPTEGTEEKHSPVLATTVPSDKNGTEEDGEDEDDWDSFQSFPASTNAAGNESGAVSSAKDPGSVENSSILEIGTGSGDSKEYSISKSLNNAEHPEAGEEEVIADSPGSQVSPQCDAPSNRIGMHEIHTSNQPFHDQLQEKEEEVVQSQGKEAISCQENEQILTDRQPVEVAEGSVGVNVAKDHEVSKDIPDTKLDQTLSGSLPLQELSGETHGQGNRRTEGEPDEATQKKMDENNGTDQQQANVNNLGIPRS
ncbi:HEAT repeat-containing protein 5A [Morella rubra]|nr:HEAT repeat-containing protein 5A [Morella rubra]